MKWLRQILRLLAIALSLPLLYLIVSLILTYIPANGKLTVCTKNKSVFISTNGVHLDIIIPVEYLSDELETGLAPDPSYKYLSFGWGDRNFYLHTPEWSDLTLNTAFQAAFLKSETLMHVTGYYGQQSQWLEIPVCDDQSSSLQAFINSYFGNKVLLKNMGYHQNDNFYEASGSYHCFYTCNTWVNSALKQSGLKACLWTPFDFGVLNLYEK